MDFTKDVVVPAALSEILSRIFSFLLDNLATRLAAGGRDAHRRRLEQLLRNIGSMVEEAEGRHITNHQLLSHLKLKALTVGMCRGHFAVIEWFETPAVVRAGGAPDQTIWESGGPEYLAGGAPDQTIWERRPMLVGVLLDLLPVRGRLQSYGYCRTPPKFTVQDVLGAGVSGGGGGESEEGFTVHLCKETLYMDHWYSITFKNDDMHGGGGGAARALTT
ncbi:unnamed protein product [Urochloa decumbens]|uniref:Uncharacterized protein n=1 Tax=Urochloa decumbens TaxID=240449 RepID=A0ABC9DKJ5_9POAL